MPADDRYAARAGRARAATGLDESVLTGEGTVFGRRVAVVACEFGFLAGSIGVAAAERITAAVERATAERLPLLASPSSGGTRMQEGTVAFLQMVKIAAAVTLHKQAHLPYLVYLRQPDDRRGVRVVGFAGPHHRREPGALIGFLGPRVYEQLYGEPFPAGVQTAENLLRHGVIDGVVALEALRRDAGARAEGGRRPTGEPPPAAEATRADARCAGLGLGGGVAATGPPGVGWLLRQGATERVLLSGTQGEAATTLLALARFGGQPAVVRRPAARHAAGWSGPPRCARPDAAWRWRPSLRLPLVLVIDTAGPALSAEAEQDGLAGEIARCLADLVTLDTPTVSVLLGQGSGGPALAMVPADRVLAALHGWLAPLPPEGASAIVFRDTAHAAELAAAQGIRSADLLRNGIVDVDRARASRRRRRAGRVRPAAVACHSR